MPICMSTAQARPKCLPRDAHPAFSLSSPHKMLLVICPCEFRLRRLAQNAGCGGVLGHFPCKFPRTHNGSCEMSVCISTAKARTQCASRSWDRSSSSTSSSTSSSYLLFSIHIIIFLSSSPSSSSSSSSPSSSSSSSSSQSSSSSSSSSSKPSSSSSPSTSPSSSASSSTTLTS